MPKLNLRAKLLLLSSLLALVPIGIAGQSLITITQDELKSSVNETLVNTADQLAKDLDRLYQDTWRAPLTLMRDAIDKPTLSVEEKLAVLTSMQSVADFVAVQITVRGIGEPILITQNAFDARLQEAGLKPGEVLAVTWQQVSPLVSQQENPSGLSTVTHIRDAKAWLVTLALPLRERIVGRQAILSARIDLGRLSQRLTDHPFSKLGRIHLVDTKGQRLFDPARLGMGNHTIVADALALLNSGSRSIGVKPYVDPNTDQAMLGGYAMPHAFDWAVIVSRDRAGAYATVSKMLHSLLLWVAFGLAAAVAGAYLFARRISRPVLDIARVAQDVGAGNFDVRVAAQTQASNDEIGALGTQINTMIEGLAERDRVKGIFGRYQTVEVMQTLLDNPDALKLGGERRNITIMMTDLRGFTALSERLAAEQVVQMLNNYYETMVDVCAKYRGTINEIIGDALLVMFGAPLPMDQHADTAIACALDMQLHMDEVNRWNAANGLPPLEMGVGLNTGDVIVGNIGSKKRAKYGIVGADVNLTARVESYSVGGQVLISPSVRDQAQGVLRIDGEQTVHPKGVAHPMTIYEVGATMLRGQHDLALHHADAPLVELNMPIDAMATILDGKHTHGAAQAVQLTALSEKSAALTTDAPNMDLPPLTNLKLQLTSGPQPARDEDLYAKVVRTNEPEAKGRCRIRFTSVAPHTAAYFAKLLS